jgi:N12 class adenine-specific DNA methylase
LSRPADLIAADRDFDERAARARDLVRQAREAADDGDPQRAVELIGQAQQADPARGDRMIALRQQYLARWLNVAGRSDDQLADLRSFADQELGTDDPAVLDEAEALIDAEMGRRGIKRFRDLQPGDVIEVNLGRGDFRYRLIRDPDNDARSALTQPVAGGPLASIPEQFGAVRLIRDQPDHAERSRDTAPPTSASVAIGVPSREPQRGMAHRLVAAVPEAIWDAEEVTVQITDPEAALAWIHAQLNNPEPARELTQAAEDRALLELRGRILLAADADRVADWHPDGVRRPLPAVPIAEPEDERERQSVDAEIRTGGDASPPTEPALESEPAAAASVDGLPRTVLVDRRPMWVRGLNPDGTVDLYDLDSQTVEAMPRNQIELNNVDRNNPIRLRLTAAQFGVATFRFEDVRSGDAAQDESLGAELDVSARELVVFQPADAIAELDSALDILRGNIRDHTGGVDDQLRRWRQEERVTRGLREKLADLTDDRTGPPVPRGPAQDTPSAEPLQEVITSSNSASAAPAADQSTTPAPVAARFRPSGQQDLAPSGAVARVRANIAALQTLRRIQDGQHPATEDEQRVLARWSGWGAVPQVFDTDRADFGWARDVLATLLSSAELDAAKRNTLNAHYTDFSLIAPIWSALRELGFSGGQVLEPGCGSGNFIGTAPPGAHVVGVEVEPVTAGIAAALYPDAEIRSESFAVTRAPEGSFDLTVGNVPFARAALNDRQHNAAGHSIHNHFILKSLHLTAPGGLVAVITSRYTLDAANPAARREMAQLADLVGAIRLPRAAHQQAAGTQVVTDLLVFRRREHDFEPQPMEWELTEVVDIDGQQARVNSYFARHPEMVCGELAVDRGQFSDAELTVAAERPAPELLEERLRLLVDHARAAELTHSPTAERPAQRRSALVGADIASRNGHLLVEGDGFAQVHDGAAEPYPVPKSQQAELRALLGLRDRVVELLEAEAASAETTPRMDQLREQLNARYNSYIARYGSLNRFSWRRTGRINEAGEPIRARVPPKQGGFRSDPAAPLVYALENFDSATGGATKADIFTQRVVARRAPRLGADTPADALAICMDTRGRADLDEIGRLLGLSPAEARQALGQLVFEDPTRGGQLVSAAEYLSGHVRDKLAAAQAATAEDPRYEANVAALTEVIPPDLAPEDIVARLGAAWIDERYVQQFLRELLEDEHLVVERAFGSNWTVKGNEYGVTATSTWGTPDLPGPKLAEALLEQRAITVHDVIEVHVPGGGISTRRVLNVAKTVAAQAKADELSARFADWIWENPQRATELARTYNDRFNSLVLRSYDDVELSLPGLAMTFKPNPHQVAAVARMRSEPAVGLYHEVGAGKTAEMAMGVMELRRLGMVRKPAIVVPNHMLDQFTREFQQLYPRAKLLAASSSDLTRDKRRGFVARIATGDWDAVIMTRGAFERIPMSPDAQTAYLDDQLSELRAAIDRKKASGSRSFTLKRMETTLLNAEERLKEKIDRDHDPTVTFEQSGIDYVVVDEAHDYKNLRTASNIPGAAIDGSGRASDLEMKLHYLRSRHGSRVVTLATATPIANSITEAHVMQRYLRPDLLETAGVRDFDTWAATFGQTTTDVELSPDGASFRLKSRFAKFHNVPELLRMWWVSGDVKTAEDLNLPRPELIARPEDGKRLPQTMLVPPTAELEGFIQELGQRAERVTTGGVDKKTDNMLMISGDGRSAALDMRLVGRPMPPGESKAEAAADKIAEVYHRHRNDHFTDSSGAPHPVPGALQIVFCDLSTPHKERWNVYDELREQLVDRGLPRGQVRFIHEARNDKEKGELFQACRSGQVSVLIGSTGKMGVGTNVQTRAAALHHLDCPWRPADLAQREGRALRRGNQYPEIGIYRWVTEGSFDAYSWQTVARKAAFIAQVMRGRLDVREIEDIGDSALSYNEVKALAAGNPLLLDKAKADAELTRLDRLERSHVQSRTRLRYSIEQNERVIERTEREISSLEAAIAQRQDTRGDRFRMAVDGRSYDARTDAGEALRDRLSRALESMSAGERTIAGIVELGGLRFDAMLWQTKMRTGYELTISEIPYAPVGGSLRSLLDSQPTSLPIRLENRLAALDKNLADARAAIERSHAEIARATAQIDQPFPHREALGDARRRVIDLEHQLSELATGKPEPEQPDSDTSSTEAADAQAQPHPANAPLSEPSDEELGAERAADRRAAAASETSPRQTDNQPSRQRPGHPALTAAAMLRRPAGTSATGDRSTAVSRRPAPGTAPRLETCSPPTPRRPPPPAR